MAYRRGRTYLWADEDGLHVWQVEPPNTEFMEASGWATFYRDEPRAAVYLPNDVFDDLVVRRYREMTPAEIEAVDARGTAGG